MKKLLNLILGFFKRNKKKTHSFDSDWLDKMKLAVKANENLIKKYNQIRNENN